MVEESANGGGSGNSVSLEFELEFAKDVRGGNKTEGEETSRRLGKQVSHVSNLEVLWKYFKEANLMDSFGSDFEGGADAGGDNSPNVLLVSKMDLDNVFNVEPEKGNISKKVVFGQ